jgi:hypothetical protein
MILTQYNADRQEDPWYACVFMRLWFHEYVKEAILEMQNGTVRHHDLNQGF